MKVLVYYPSNKRTNSIETLLLLLKQRGYEIILLTTSEKDDLHVFLGSIGIETYTHLLLKGNSLFYFIKHIRYLIKFCKLHEIEIVMSHLQQANIVSVFAQYFTKTKFIIFRHHFQFLDGNKDINIKQNKTEKIFDQIINRCSKIIVVPSSGVYNGMLEQEKIKRNKLKIIPYIYDFSKYQKPNAENCEKLKNEFKAKLVLMMASRLIDLKRHQLIFKIVNSLVKQGYDIKMLVLDDGPERQNLERYIKDNDLANNIFLLGFRKDFIDYMNVSDILIHPSLSEASNSVVKEFGLLGKPVVVCSGVGDFDDYIVNEQNGFLVSRSNTEKEMSELIVNVYNHKYDLAIIGQLLNDKVMSTFNMSPKVIDQYFELFNSQ